MDGNSNRHSSWLDLARWAAALFVVNLHVWALLVTISPHLSRHPTDLNFFPIVERLGDEAVVILDIWLVDRRYAPPRQGNFPGGTMRRAGSAGSIRYCFQH